VSKTVPFEKRSVNQPNNNQEDSRAVVRRNELKEIMKQVIDNMNEMAGHLMNDINTMFKRFVYPLTIRTNAIENILISKGILTKDDINAEAKKITEEAIAKAKEVDENGNPKSGAPGERAVSTESASIEKIEPPEMIGASATATLEKV
jgi:hypothetical protein